MRWLFVLIAVGCGAPAPAPPATPAGHGWPLPEGWKREEIPFPLGFAPTLNHQGVEELRFPPGFLVAASPNRWSYAFEWKLTDEADLDAAALGAELVTYFRGLLVAVDADRHRFDPTAITARATPLGDGFAIEAHVFDAFGDAAAIDLVGTARRHMCAPHRVVWRFVLAPSTAPIRTTLDDLAATRPCG
jgi:hypothetical protein